MENRNVDGAREMTPRELRRSQRLLLLAAAVVVLNVLLQRLFEREVDDRARRRRAVRLAGCVLGLAAVLVGCWFMLPTACRFALAVLWRLFWFLAGG